MNPDDYQKQAFRTAPQMYKTLTHQQMQLVQGVLGLCKETGELADTVYRHIFYGVALDVDNIDEENGDLEWYIGLIQTAIGFTMSLMMERNISKLRTRFPDKFSPEDAIARRDKQVHVAQLCLPEREAVSG